MGCSGNIGLVYNRQDVCLFRRFCLWKCSDASQRLIWIHRNMPDDCDDECRSVFSRLFHRDCNCELEASNVRHELNLREFLEAESNIGGLIVLVIIWEQCKWTDLWKRRKKKKIYIRWWFIYRTSCVMWETVGSWTRAAQGQPGMVLSLISDICKVLHTDSFESWVITYATLLILMQHHCYLLPLWVLCFRCWCCRS